MYLICGALALWNTATFIMFGIDKQRSKRKKWRISERTLILSSLALGGIGSIIGMCVFHHKTLHKKFTVLIPFSAVLTLFALYYIFTYLGGF